MVPAPPPLPMRFPCWCRAVYSWGGESKRDLGFIEGDLIECLNAGDGSWWTGRLRRDRRMVGVFPSNFVEVLPDDFRPVSRSTSPMPPSNTPSPKNLPQKSKTFRKPFEAYAKAPHYTTAKQPETYRPGAEPQPREPPPSRQPRQPRQIRQTQTRQPQHLQQPQQSRPQQPPQPPQHPPQHPPQQPPQQPQQPYHPQPPRSRENSHNSITNSILNSHDTGPPPSQFDSYGSRAPSPAPSIGYRPYRPHADSVEQPDSPPPPPPPPHRSALVTRHGSNLSYDNQSAGYNTPRMPSPCPPSPAGHAGMTPSPLREAMDGVMEQLDALGMHTQEPESPGPPQNFDPWSPESFDMVRHQEKKRGAARPQTSMGLGHQDSGYGSGASSREPTFYGDHPEDPHLPQLSNYVERMESRLRQMHQGGTNTADDEDEPPPPPPKGQVYDRPKSSLDGSLPAEKKLRHRKSAYEVGRQMLGRTFTNKTNSTNASSGLQSNSSQATQSTDRSLMSGSSAGGISATSAGSFARKNLNRAQSALGMRDLDVDRPESPFTGVTYHSSHASGAARPPSQAGFQDDSMGMLGGLVQAKPKKQNIFKKILESAKTGVASGRSNIQTGADTGRPSAMSRSMGSGLSGGMVGFGSAHNLHARDAARDMGLGSGVDWVQVRRDVNRSNTLSRNERNERRDRCQMMDHPAIDPVDELYDGMEGDEGADGMPIAEPTNYNAINLSQVDKNSRFISGLPPTTTAVTLATTYVCRPYRSDVQRLRAIFTWVAEKISWEEDFEGEIDTRRVIQTKRACAEEYAVLVLEMCAAVGLQCEVIRGYLKTPGEVPETGIMPRPNHWWNAVLVDDEWRMMDCCLATPSNPNRALYSSSNSAAADAWWFLARPTEICWTHIPEYHEQQHICPPVSYEVLLNLPCACPPFFKDSIQMVDYNTSLMRIEDLEMVHITFNVPADVEVAAEVEVRDYSRDSDGDFFESGDVVRKRALAQAEWYGGAKRYTVKALLPGDEGQGVLKVYVGKRGLMQSIKDIPHPLAFALPIVHTGENPPYEFVTRHPTPHAQRHDIYVVQPQCQRLALNNTFVFAIRQHPSSLGAAAGGGGAMTPSSNPGGASPVPFARPGSAMSMGGSSAAGSNPSTASSGYAGPGGKKPAKLAIQTPGGKILRLMRKEERRRGGGGRSASAPEDEVSDGGTWETIIKCSEKGLWRGLVLADRTARWCVFAEWVCVG